MQSLAQTVPQPGRTPPTGIMKGTPAGKRGSEAMDYDDVSDLIEAVAAHDKQAFAELFRYFAPRIKAYAMRSGGDAASAEELAQETMVSVWRQAGRFDRRRAAGSTWIFAIARNRRIDLWRRESRPEIDPEDPALNDGPTEAPDAAHEARQAERRLRDAVGDLPPDQAEVLHKTYFEGKSQSAVSEELGLPLGTVKSRIRLGLARLRGSMAGFEL